MKQLLAICLTVLLCGAVAHQAQARVGYFYQAHTLQLGFTHHTMLGNGIVLSAHREIHSKCCRCRRPYRAVGLEFMQFKRHQTLNGYVLRSFGNRPVRFHHKGFLMPYAGAKGGVTFTPSTERMPAQQIGTLAPLLGTTYVHGVANFIALQARAQAGYDFQVNGEEPLGGFHFMLSVGMGINFDRKEQFRSWKARRKAKRSEEVPDPR